jgi:putative ABC transport system permease protein
MAAFGSELRRTIRALVRRPGYLLVGSGILAGGLTLSLMMFDAVNGFALRPLPFPRASSLAEVYLSLPERDMERAPATAHDLAALRERQHSFEELAGFYGGTVNLSDGERPERFDGGFITANLFRTLGVAPERGRDLLDDDCRPGAPPVVLIGHDFWARRFNSAPDLIGSTLRVNGRPATVVGIMPPRFSFPVYQQLWVPVTIDLSRPRRPDDALLLLVGRLRPGATFGAAAKEIGAIAAELGRARPELDTAVAAVVRPLSQFFVDPGMRLTLAAMLGCTTLVLLIACANVANLTMLHATTRSRELAVRAALGAGRARVAASVALEALVVVTVAVAIGLPLARLLSRLAIGWYRAGGSFVPYWMETTSDWRSNLFACSVTLIGVVVAGLIPALRASGGELTATLRSGGRGIAGSSLSRMTRNMVAAEIALGVVVLTCAGLMARSVIAVNDVDVGVDTRNTLTGRIGLFAGAYPEPADCTRLVAELTERLAALPGVTAATATTGLPGMNVDLTEVEVEGLEKAAGQARPVAGRVSVEPSYFAAFGLRPLAGRLLAATDDAQAPRVAVVADRLARRITPDGQVVGRRLRSVAVAGGVAPGPWLTIVGVVPNVLQSEIDRTPRGSVYLPLAQEPSRFVSLVVRTSGDPMALADALRRTVAAADSDLPVYWLETLDARLDRGRFLASFLATLFGGFAGVGLLLAAVGLYAVLAFEVARQTPEIGVRRALGATNHRLLAAVMGRHAIRFAIAIGAGLVLSAGFAQALASVLFGVSPFDLLTFTVVGVTIALTCTLAALVPVLRALRVQPASVLRYE